MKKYFFLTIILIVGGMVLSCDGDSGCGGNSSYVECDGGSCGGGGSAFDEINPRNMC